jgi:predicted transcriptional regulator
MNLAGRDDDPDRLYTLTGGRSRPSRDCFDLVTLVVGEAEAGQGLQAQAMQSEHVAILRLARRPVAVVEIAADLRLPVSIAKILLSDMLDAGLISVRHPQSAARQQNAGLAQLPDHTTLEKVLVGLRDL